MCKRKLRFRCYWHFKNRTRTITDFIFVNVERISYFVIWLLFCAGLKLTLRQVLFLVVWPNCLDLFGKNCSLLSSELNYLNIFRSHSSSDSPMKFGISCYIFSFKIARVCITTINNKNNIHYSVLTIFMWLAESLNIRYEW